MSAVMNNDPAALLPFWVNGTLDADEQAQVAAALAESNDLQQEADVLALMRAKMQAQDIGWTPGDIGLARLMRGIDAETVAPSTRWQGFGGRIAAMLAVAVVSAGATAALLRPDAPVYVQASGEMVNAAQLTVTFQPTATEAQMADLLLSNGLLIVDGPSALGLYRVEMLDPVDPAAMAALLRDMPDVIKDVVHDGEDIE